MKLTPEIITLHRYFIWADRMRVHFDYILRNSKPASSKLLQKKEGIDTFLYMSLWYGMFYVLIEGWLQLGFEDEKIDELLKSNNVKLLKRYRNGVFHFQKEYYDKRLTKLMTEGENIAVWIRDLREEFSRWFLVIHGKMPKTT
ncbi:MAG: hypothetical protein UT93_C0004G0012 [Candidatus Woesebacteria bacterium GW2011_GWF1_40_24]|uniref:RiboL-PSP-HEPN domain-containing protein n=1 Tax=Candidatus Woesebacteria bacterium GW2011_GWF1_40_24 TaxID=1618601 RepID=A0A0G0RU06_9BACT|nr:MAG: hypothetical protein UT93_C0004G0012 [Candidatus Woesebacteria bacterium GW2011_GWF1_40_24]